MKVLLDDTPCDIDAQGLGPAISAAATMAEQQGRMIVEVRVDGETWSAEQLDGLSEHTAAVAEVHLTTASTDDLIRQTIADSINSLDGVDSLQREAAALIEADRIEEAMQPLRNALTGWGGVQQAVSMIAAALGLDLDQIEVDGTPVPTIVTGLHEQLQIIAHALTKQDPVGLADTLQYELPPVVQQWRDLLTKLGAGEQ